MNALLQDLKFGLRMLAKNPGFTAVAVLTLALGIGANTAIFSVVNAVLLRPLPFPKADRIVSVVSTLPPANTPDNASYPDFLDWRARNHVFESMAAYRTESLNLTGTGTPLHLRATIASADLFKVLRAKPRLGRAFLPNEDTPGAVNGTNAAILSHGLWQRRFGSDPHVVGRTIDLDGKPYTVVGVMPAGFQFPIQNDPIDVWTTIAPDLTAIFGGKSMASQRGAHYLDVVARLKPNLTVAQAQGQMSMIVRTLSKQYPENKVRTVSVKPELTEIMGDVRVPLLVLMAAVGFVLLIACANVANLLLARATTRQKEMAVRAALGATRGRVIRQVLTESLFLASFGGGLGILVALWAIEFLKKLVPQDVPRIAQIGLDGPVLVFTIGLSLLTGVFFGIAPALQSSKTSLVEDLKEGGRQSTGGERHGRVRNFLVVGEVAMAMWLLIGAGLLIRSFLRLENVQPGFDPHYVLTFNLGLSAKYNSAQMTHFFEEAVKRIGRIPGVQSASCVVPLPLSGDSVTTGFYIEGQPNVPGHNPDTDYSWVEPGYFRTLGIALLKGRDFTFSDTLQSPPVVIINQTMAKRFFPGQDPIGKHLDPQIGNGYKKPPMREVVGVVQDVKLYHLNDNPGPQVYVPLSQSPLDVMTFVVRTGIDPQSVVSAARRQIGGLDKDLPVFGTKTLDEYVGGSVAQPRFNTLLLSIFGGVALLLALVGIYGVISYSVTQRTHEIGIRMALGAERVDVLGMVVKQGMILVIWGIGIGLASALILTRIMSDLLYSVPPDDPVTFLVVPIFLMAVSTAASYIPARRAARVDPMVALRNE